jgi:hypothetical protein
MTERNFFVNIIFRMDGVNVLCITVQFTVCVWPYCHANLIPNGNYIYAVDDHSSKRSPSKQGAYLLNIWENYRSGRRKERMEIINIWFLYIFAAVISK